MFFDAAWSATNEQRFGAEDPDTKKNADQCKEHYESLKATGEVSDELAESLYQMGWHAAFHAAHIRGEKELSRPSS